MSICYSASGIPEPCGGWKVYDSYVTDPRFQEWFTVAWTAAFGVVFVATVPSIVKSTRARLRRRHHSSVKALAGVYEETSPRGYEQLTTERPSPPRPVTRTRSRHSLKGTLFVTSLTKSLARRVPPLPKHLAWTSSSSCHPSRPLAPFSLGTLVAVLLLPALFLATLLPASQLYANPNRFGFLSLAAIPLLFVLSAKNGAIALFLGRAWNGVNFLHRWLGRIVFVLTLVHAAIWSHQWHVAGRLGEFLDGSKARRGIGALASLLLIALSSARPVRRFSHTLFFVCHYIGIVTFLVFVNRHTVFARGWATWAVIGPFAFDVACRLLSMRLRYVEVEPLDGGMVRIALRDLKGGWRAGQHLSIRLFFSPPSASIWSAFRPFEAHPFSITNAPSSDGVLNADNPHRGIELFARSQGPNSWTGDLLETAQCGDLVARSSGQPKKQHMLALVEGPYGGLGPYTITDQENILLVAGGSGMSFIVGVLDEIVATRLRLKQGGRIQVVWAVRDRAHVRWFSDQLRTIIEAVESFSTLKITLRIFLTCDPTITTVETVATSSSSSSTRSAATATHLDLPHSQLILSRPNLPEIVRDQVDAALAPCGNCFPVCRCGDVKGDGICANNEVDCVQPSSSEVVGNARDEEAGDIVSELPVLGAGTPSVVGTNGSEKKSEGKDEISLAPTVTKGQCCSSSNALANEKVGRGCQRGCCASTGDGCCSGKVEGDEEKATMGPIRVSTGGFGVAVCGPKAMVGELQNALAAVPLSRQVRIGGISLHTESFSV